MKIPTASGLTALLAIFAGQCAHQDELLLDEPEIPAEQTVGQAEGAFRISCMGGQLSYDDPIVAPGRPNATHLHQYFGNVDADAFTTSNNIALTAGEPTCQGGSLNQSAYWLPALIDTGTNQVVPIDVAVVYYKGEPHHEAGPVQPLPRGLKMISDDGTWSCDGQQKADTIMGGCTGQLTASINFKFCWNGELDSPDHRSHLANTFYDNGVERCPSTHPTVIPRVSYHVHYDATGMSDTSNFILSSDVDPMMTELPAGVQAPAGTTLHADYFYGWYRQDANTGKTFADVWYENCLLAFKDCTFGDLGDGRRLRAWPEGVAEQQAVPAPPPMPS